MNIQSYTVLHYGADYLSYALRSVYDRVSQLHVIYTPIPSHGHGTDRQPPESRNELVKAAFRYNPDSKIKWYDIDWIHQEGQQRDYAVQICRQNRADLILVVDCDEVWPADTLTAALNHVWQANSARNWLINFSHFWRSFNYVCKDNNWPVRIIDLRHNAGTGYISTDFGDIYHFGYAVTDKIMSYKWAIHGHKGELRPSWWDKWRAWPPAEDCHPTNDNNWWMPQPFDKGKLPDFMYSHPFYNLGRIE